MNFHSGRNIQVYFRWFIAILKLKHYIILYKSANLAYFLIVLDRFNLFSKIMESVLRNLQNCFLFKSKLERISKFSESQILNILN